MPHDSVWSFFIDNLKSQEINGKKLLEIGSYHRFGGIRKLIESYFTPLSYTGVDIKAGPGVDHVASFESLLDMYKHDTFDVVFAVEVMEHILDYKLFLNTMKRLLREGGIIFITTRSINFGYHLAPFDYWRFSLDTMARLFSDMQIDKLISDPEYPGVFIKAMKPIDFQIIDLGSVKAYSIIRSMEIGYIPNPNESRLICKLSKSLTNTKIPLYMDIAAVLNHFIK